MFGFKEADLSNRNAISIFWRYLSSKNSRSCQQTLLNELIVKKLTENICLSHHLLECRGRKKCFGDR